MLELMEELQEVVGWYDVGISLTVPRHVLETKIFRAPMNITKHCSAGGWTITWKRSGLQLCMHFQALDIAVLQPQLPITTVSVYKSINDSESY